MARGELLSVLGLYRYDPTIFDNMAVPYGISKDDLVAEIIFETAELEVLIPDSDLFKSMVGVWSNVRMKSWNDMMNVLTVRNYEPFINLDRTETETRNLTGTAKNTRTFGDQNQTTPNLTTTDQIQSYDSGAWQDRQKRMNTGTETSRHTGTIGDDGTTTDGGTITRRTVGDSAMYTKQNIIEQEMKIRETYDIYQIIISEFKKQFCLLIY